MTSPYKSILCIVFVFIVILTGCTSKISDSDISNQVKDYLMKIEVVGIKFLDHYDIKSISVKDKSVKENSLVAICNITVGVKRSYESTSSIDSFFGSIVGSGAGHPGETKSSEHRVVFEKFEKGWRLSEFN